MIQFFQHIIYPQLFRLVYSILIGKKYFSCEFISRQRSGFHFPCRISFFLFYFFCRDFSISGRTISVAVIGSPPTPYPSFSSLLHFHDKNKLRSSDPTPSKLPAALHFLHRLPVFAALQCCKNTPAEFFPAFELPGKFSEPP